MRANKNSSDEELDICPKKHPRTSLLVDSKSCSYEKATDPGNSLGSVVETIASTTDRNTAIKLINEHIGEATRAKSGLTVLV